MRPRRHPQRNTRASTKAGVAPAFTSDVLVATSGCPWGYADLKEALADPHHEDHESMLDWLGLDSVEGFDPAACDLGEISAVLGLTVATRR
jgi:hypothetical protein